MDNSELQLGLHRSLIGLEKCRKGSDQTSVYEGKGRLISRFSNLNNKTEGSTQNDQRRTKKRFYNGSLSIKPHDRLVNLRGFNLKSSNSYKNFKKIRQNSPESNIIYTDRGYTKSQFEISPPKVTGNKQGRKEIQNNDNKNEDKHHQHHQLISKRIKFPPTYNKKILKTSGMESTENSIFHPCFVSILQPYKI